MSNEPVRRLNWGCGRDSRPGWINSDRRRVPGVDLVGDIRDGLALDTESIDYAVSIHALHALSYPEVVPALQELRRVLKPGGVLRLVLADLHKAIEAFRAGNRDYFPIPDDDATQLSSKLALYLTWYGYTRTIFTPDFAEELLRKAGFNSVARCQFKTTSSRWPEIVEPDNREQESFYIEATK